MSSSQPPFLALQPTGRTMGHNGCANCVVFHPCGGHPEPLIREVGCASYANTSTLKNTDDMNPHFPEKFWELWEDVGGLEDYTVSKLLSINPKGLPHYVPMIQGRHLRPSKPLDLPTVALPLFHVVGRRKDGSYGPRFPSASALRTAYNLREDTRILLIGVDHDPMLETFWAKHRSHDVCDALAKLGLEVTAPNFSFFTCVPRFQILRNRKRILLTAERLSQAGVRVSPHINANTQGDWDFWLNFLHEHPEVTTITMEFQTGAKANKTVGDEAFQQLLKMLKSLGKPVHCLLVGAGRYYQTAKNHLKAFTVIDSVPYMYATRRRMFTRDVTGHFDVKKVPTREHASLQALFEVSLRNYESMLSKGRGSSRPAPQPDTKQQDLLY